MNVAYYATDVLCIVIPSFPSISDFLYHVMHIHHYCYFSTITPPLFITILVSKYAHYLHADMQTSITTNAQGPVPIYKR